MKLAAWFIMIMNLVVAEQFQNWLTKFIHPTPIVLHSDSKPKCLLSFCIPLVSSKTTWITPQSLQQISHCFSSYFPYFSDDVIAPDKMHVRIVIVFRKGTTRGMQSHFCIQLVTIPHRIWMAAWNTPTSTTTHTSTHNLMATPLCVMGNCLCLKQ